MLVLAIYSASITVSKTGVKVEGGFEASVDKISAQKIEVQQLIVQSASGIGGGGSVLIFTFGCGDCSCPSGCTLLKKDYDKMIVWGGILETEYDIFDGIGTLYFCDTDGCREVYSCGGWPCICACKC